eukprot:symbB.v1.2.016042.t1/scaffold1212.1/size131235/8
MVCTKDWTGSHALCPPNAERRLRHPWRREFGLILSAHHCVVWCAEAVTCVQEILDASQSNKKIGAIWRLDGGVKDPDGGAIIEDTSCKRPEMQENAHGTGLKAGIQLGLSTIFFLGIPIGIVGGFFYQIYEKAAEVRQKHEAEVAAVEKAKVAEAKAKAKAKFKMKAKAKPKAKAQEEMSSRKSPDLIWPIWEALSPVQRADIFRYLVLWDQGGYYADIDCRCTKPIAEFPVPKDASMIVGYEAAHRLGEKERKSVQFARVEQFENWFFASAPGNPVLLRALEIVREKFLWKVQDTVDFTGPGSFSDAVHEFWHQMLKGKK